MNFKFLIRQVVSLPPHIVFKKACKVIHRAWQSRTDRIRDVRSSTYSRLPNGPATPLFYSIKIPENKLSSACKQILALTEHVMAHRFDLLGSGWVPVRYGLQYRGLEGCLFPPEEILHAGHEAFSLEGRINPANLQQSKKIFKQIGPDYVPIDWQVDFKSGYRWSEKTHRTKIEYGHKPGADVKIPWELARMQHLPQLAWAYQLARQGIEGFRSPDPYVQEFKNQVLDFIAANPPRYGVNWSCTMDVGIRIGNWLMAYDLFKSVGAGFGTEFESEFTRSAYDHARHIARHLEWNPSMRSNHYLANVAGLLFAAAHLPRSPETDAWLAFSVQELVSEMDSQFNADGTNFEGSTSYHRLSSEMMVTCTALVLGLPPDKLEALKNYDPRRIEGPPSLQPPPLKFYDLPGLAEPSPFPPWFVERLEKMAEFTQAITKPNGCIVQIGDNDSGRFLKLHPGLERIPVKEAVARYRNLEGYTSLPEEAAYWDENVLDHRHLIAAVNGLFQRNDWKTFAEEKTLETSVIEQLAGGRFLPSYLQNGRDPDSQNLRVGTEADWTRQVAKLDSFPESQRHLVEISGSGGDLRDGLSLAGFPDFGLYIFRSARLFLSVRLGPVGQKGSGGHAHNDQLAIELALDGEDRIVDPGTYLYTPLPARRNEFRSITAHFAPQLDAREPASLDQGLFVLQSKAEYKCLYFGERGFIGSHSAFGVPVTRVIQLSGQAIQIKDYVEGSGRLRPSRPAESKAPFSPGYGKLLR